MKLQRCHAGILDPTVSPGFTAHGPARFLPPQPPPPFVHEAQDAIFRSPRLILHILCKHLLLCGGFNLQLKKKKN